MSPIFLVKYGSRYQATINEMRNVVWLTKGNEAKRHEGRSPRLLFLRGNTLDGKPENRHVRSA